MAPPRATRSMDSSPKSAKRRVSGVIPPEYPQPPMFSLKIFVKSGVFWSRSTSAISCPFTQRACDDKVAVTDGVDRQEHPCQFRELTGKPVSNGHFHHPVSRLHRSHEHAPGA